MVFDLSSMVLCMTSMTTKVVEKIRRMAPTVLRIALPNENHRLDPSNIQLKINACNNFANPLISTIQCRKRYVATASRFAIIFSLLKWYQLSKLSLYLSKYLYNNKSNFHLFSFTYINKLCIMYRSSAHPNQSLRVIKNHLK